MRRSTRSQPPHEFQLATPARWSGTAVMSLALNTALALAMSLLAAAIVLSLASALGNFHSTDQPELEIDRGTLYGTTPVLSALQQNAVANAVINDTEIKSILKHRAYTFKRDDIVPWTGTDGMILGAIADIHYTHPSNVRAKWTDLRYDCATGRYESTQYVMTRGPLAGVIAFVKLPDTTLLGIIPDPTAHTQGTIPRKLSKKGETCVSR